MTATTLPTGAGELEEILNDSKRVAEMFNQDGTPKPEFAEFIKAYASAKQGPDTDLARAVEAETQRVLTNWLKENQAEHLNRLNLSPQGGVRSGSDAVATGRGAVYNEAAPGAQIDHLFKDSVDYLKTIWWNNHSTEAQNKRTQLRNDYGSVVPADGGFLIPERLRATLLQVALENAVVRPRATVIPMDSARVPLPMIDETSHASSVFGGVQAFWTEESAPMDDTEASFAQVVLDAKTLTALSYVPNQLLADSIISFAAFINQTLPRAIAWFEDTAYMTGSGVGEPLGWIGCPATVSVAAEGGQAASTIVYENIVKMYARMLPSSLSNGVWIANNDTFPELATMALSVGTGGAPVFISNASEGPPMTIFGRPVIFTEKARGLGTAGDLNFVDLSYYLVGDRQTMTAMTSEHIRFNRNQTAFRVVERVDGRPWIQSAITPQNSSDTLSPYVNLATRS